MQIVGVGMTLPVYSGEPPYHPDTAFPEMPFQETSACANRPYALLRRMLHEMGCDATRYASADWNPLGHVISPGNTVVLKPNFVIHRNRLEGQDVFAVVTHPSILRCLVDYAYIALKGSGRIIIADCPQMDCDWDALMRVQRLDAVQQFYHQTFRFEVEVRDLRRFKLIDPYERAYSYNRQPLAGDPLGSAIINLGRQSEFYGLPSENYYGADYDRSETIRHHQGETHEYSVSRTVLSADAVICVPKMKVHKKVGVTLNLKGLVGINTDKNYLVHFRLGSPGEGGDQLPDGQGRRDRFTVRVNNWLYDHSDGPADPLGGQGLRCGAPRVPVDAGQGPRRPGDATAERGQLAWQRLGLADDGGPGQDPAVRPVRRYPETGQPPAAVLRCGRHRRRGGQRPHVPDRQALRLPGGRGKSVRGGHGRRQAHGLRDPEPQAVRAGLGGQSGCRVPISR